MAAAAGLKVLLPEIMHLRDLTDGPRKYRLRAHLTKDSDALFLVNSRCAKPLPCRYAYVGRRKLTGYADRAILNGPR